MDFEDLDRKIDKRADTTDARVEAIRLDMNGRLRAVERFQHRMEGALLGGRLLPALVALAAAGAAWIAVLK